MYQREGGGGGWLLKIPEISQLNLSFYVSLFYVDMDISYDDLLLDLFFI